MKCNGENKNLSRKVVFHANFLIDDVSTCEAIQLKSNFYLALLPLSQYNCSFQTNVQFNSMYFINLKRWCFLKYGLSHTQKTHVANSSIDIVSKTCTVIKSESNCTLIVYLIVAITTQHV